MVMVLMIVLKVARMFDDGEDDSDGDDIDGDCGDDDCNDANRVSHQQQPSGGYQSNGGDTSALDNR